MRRETLPTAKVESGRIALLAPPYDPEGKGLVTCTPYGEMEGGLLVWADDQGKQYTRNRIYGKYYFVEL